MSHFYPENYNFKKKNPSRKAKEYDIFLVPPRNILLYTVIRVYQSFFLNLRFYPLYGWSENIENALKHEIFKMIIES